MLYRIIAMIVFMPLLSACAPQTSNVVVTNAWARPAFASMGETTPETDATQTMDMNGETTSEMPMDSGGVSAAYMTLENRGSAADRLIGASSDAAEIVEIHEVVMDNEMMRMRPVEGIDIPANGAVQLKPGGYHIMMMGLRHDLAIGDTIQILLQFQSGKTLTVEVPVQEQPTES